MLSIGYYLLYIVRCVLKLSLALLLTPFIVVILVIDLLVYHFQDWKDSLPRGERSDPPRGERDADDGGTNEGDDR